MTADRPGSPTPIDPRGPRFNQGVLTVVLLGGFLLDWRWVIPVFAVVLLLGAAFGPRYGPVLRFFVEVVKPRLGPPAEMEDPRPPRFAAAIGVLFLGAGFAGSTRRRPRRGLGPGPDRGRPRRPGRGQRRLHRL